MTITPGKDVHHLVGDRVMGWDKHNHSDKRRLAYTKSRFEREAKQYFHCTDIFKVDYSQNAKAGTTELFTQSEGQLKFINTRCH